MLGDNTNFMRFFGVIYAKTPLLILRVGKTSFIGNLSDEGNKTGSEKLFRYFVTFIQTAK